MGLRRCWWSSSRQLHVGERREQRNGKTMIVGSKIESDRLPLELTLNVRWEERRENTFRESTKWRKEDIVNYR